MNSAPQTSEALRSRRLSFTSDSSPLHASMVGSYEESILRGRMSTTPSKPLNFLAQIGVLGLGKCKPNLRCPAHVTIPFPAVFYSYETTAHGRIGRPEDGPSPYVGHIDLENNLPNLDGLKDSKRKRFNVTALRSQMEKMDATDGVHPERPSRMDARKADKQKRRRSISPRAPPGGSYRIPEKGQLQIIIKNPNKTAVKLFLVPYDLAGMEPGTKTFVRHRSYSAGPIIDAPISSIPEQTQTAINSSDRPTLRYLIHLQMCCPSRGRFYLYKSIRVVFANRVPDGKEKLRNEISMPEPRFSVYKPIRELSSGSAAMSGVGLSFLTDQAHRRSSGFVHRTGQRADSRTERTMGTPAMNIQESPSFSYRQSTMAGPVQSIPFSLSRSRNHTGDDEFQRLPDIHSPTSSKSSRPQTAQDSGIMSWGSDNSVGAYDKLAIGDVGYGGNVFGSVPDGKQTVAESLLAIKLRTLGVGAQNQQDNLSGI